MQKYKETRIFIDMDGVIAKWNPYASEEDTHMLGYFLHRDRETEAIQLVKRLFIHGYQVCILSSVYEDDHSDKDKLAWLEKAGLGKIPHIFVPYGKDKHQYVSHNDESLDVLIDDYGRNLSEWAAQGKLAIKFFNGINNKPKLKLDGEQVVIDMDAWGGYSIDHRMTAKQMFTVVTGIITAITSNIAEMTA